MITIKDCQFTPYLSPGEIASRVQALAQSLSEDYAGKDPLFIAVLNGSFMFAADLFRLISIPATISFVKMSSYQAMDSTGEVEEILGLEVDLRNRHVIIIEDIIESGLTLDSLKKTMLEMRPSSIEVVALLRKPMSMKKSVDVKYIGFDIEERFVVGYGLDYDGYGRNLDSIYQVVVS